jgi:hypothetical protein
MATVRDVLAEQLDANRSSAGERERFASHRARLTELCERGVEAGSELSLCVLGAGNANDLDLDRLATRYRRIHLVDLDAEAVAGALGRASETTRPKLESHAPVDVSGLLDRLERWQRLEVTPEELAGHPEQTARRLSTELAGPFDVVVSACLLTQMQLGVLSVLGDRHRLFEAVRYTLTLSHLRTLTALARPGGRVLLVSDLSASEIAPAIATAEDAELDALVPKLIAAGQVFQVAQPKLLRDMALDDPWLSGELELGPSLEVWRWQNGPRQTFLVYAFEARRRP